MPADLDEEGLEGESGAEGEGRLLGSGGLLGAAAGVRGGGWGWGRPGHGMKRRQRENPEDGSVVWRLAVKCLCNRRERYG